MKLPEGITEQMVDTAKAAHGADKLRFIDLPLDDEGSAYKTVLASVPTRTVISQYKRWVEADPKKAEEILVKANLLSHKDEVMADDGLFYAALNGITQLMPIRRGIVKNL